MSRTFRRNGKYVAASFEAFEVELLRRLGEQLQDMLDHRDRDDPVVRRLFPPAVLGDAEAADEVRELIEADLLSDRLEGLQTLLALLERGQIQRGRLVVDLHDDEPVLVLSVLNDLRLAIGARIDIEALDRETVTEDDPVAYQLAVMDHLGWWQEQLLDQLG